jgi:tetratricopeptide (TPR) repeat protein
MASLKRLQVQHKLQVEEAERSHATKPSLASKENLDRAQKDLLAATKALAELEQFNDDLNQARQDATQVIQTATGEDRDKMLADALQTRGQAAEALGEFASAFRDYGELLNLSDVKNDRPLYRQILMKHGWMALNPVIEQWEDAKSDFQAAANLAGESTQKSSFATQLDHSLAQAGLACATLRLGNAPAALQIIDSLGAKIDQQQPRNPPEWEIWRRIQHTRADVYAQASIQRSQTGRIDALQQKAISALKRAISRSSLPNVPITDPIEGQQYWQSYVMRDPDLQPIRDTIGYQTLRKDFESQSVSATTSR